MVTGTNFQSDSELIKRLQSALRDADVALPGSPRAENSVRDVEELVTVLAGRIYEDPSSYGLDAIPSYFRADAAADALMALLFAVPSFKGKENIGFWYSQRAEEIFQSLWAVAEDSKNDPTPILSEKSAPKLNEPQEGTLFDTETANWQRFETEFPRDAFALRLRFMLGQTPAEMAVMLDSPSERAINLRLARARDRLRMFFQQAGYDRQRIETLMSEFAEIPE